MSSFNRRAVFFDRDGTVVKSIYRTNIGRFTAPFSLQELEFAPNSEIAVRTLKNNDFLCILATNQPDVSYGYITPDDWSAIQKAVIAKLPFDDVFMCRHPRTEQCYFRKPNPGMLLAAADKFGIDPRQSWMIGDMDVDMRAGKAAGCKTILLNRPYNKDFAPLADYAVDDVLQAAMIAIPTS
ncbi:MAG: HAD-IIIA family hydrolase [Patescibacteria group bacterium]